ncbi:3-carboxyethylcatechol 2,3-dioxygenase [Kaistia dalseonensis]|uniref:2,3-dihydroxyphenylpropionate 1,2-dioxygenase n=1 Tax=Kaistia dalseonensis TaxID=410840 RepID=A0ABU0H751_9HYPH|nr:3-carboxyethylcatechol 2,3-dioxygenase [Kaistia dalseonensis]MCX5495529.1 3-carboxyethylcatechol 2,3-dioxygenase [Kaistia dalseonensis]MDQ0438121.1 2,3-dihydroxyphenylpropionate 1,2-dioxygenase [Kaistia dalseonensis]
MIAGAVCLSHSPLMDHNRADAGVEARFNAALKSASRKIAEWEPDLCVVFFPDHFNGFFYDLMPAFCIGAAANSIGDFGSVPGQLDVPEDIAVDIATSCTRSGVDIALSYRMQVDHGAVQPVELLSEFHSLTRIVPIFINCAAPPRPTFARVRALGEAVGVWANRTSQRVLFLASGGLSHDPPIPAMKGATPDVRAKLIDGRAASHAARLSRQTRIHGAGHAYVSGTSPLRPLNPTWDRDFLDHLTREDLTVGDDWRDDDITEAAGRGAHEVRSWIAAFGALSAAGHFQTTVEFYEPVPEWITGMAIATATPRSAT